MGRRKYPYRKRILDRPTKFVWPHYVGLDNLFMGWQSYMYTKTKHKPLSSDRPMIEQPKKGK